MARSDEGRAGGGRTVIVLGTGGTIAGTAQQATESVRYTSAQLGAEALVAAVPALREVPIEAEQVAQLDSKDMEPSVWVRLAQRVAHHLGRDEVAGVVITHGTDTLEETAWVLHRLVDAHRPVVLTAAMRPATSLQADGPQNLLDAVTVAREPGARGVVVAMGGQVQAGADVRKVRSWGLDAFAAVRGGPVALVQAGRVIPLRPWPGDGRADPAPALPADGAAWPWVEVVTSHAGADARAVEALVAAGVRGLAVAATGNGSVHHRLEAALAKAMAQGVAVRRATRCAFDGIVEGGSSALPAAQDLTPAQARAELMLALLPRQG